MGIIRYNETGGAENSAAPEYCAASGRSGAAAGGIKMIKTKEKTIIDGKEVPFYALSNKYLQTEIIAPPMAEGLANTPKGIYLAFESGAAKYRCDGGKYPTENLYITTME